MTTRPDGHTAEEHNDVDLAYRVLVKHGEVRRLPDDVQEWRRGMRAKARADRLPITTHSLGEHGVVAVLTQHEADEDEREAALERLKLIYLGRS